MLGTFKRTGNDGFGVEENVTPKLLGNEPTLIWKPLFLCRIGIMRKSQ